MNTLPEIKLLLNLIFNQWIKSDIVLFHNCLCIVLSDI
jgi:hypothetical protein